MYNLRKKKKGKAILERNHRLRFRVKRVDSRFACSVFVSIQRHLSDALSANCGVLHMIIGSTASASGSMVLMLLFVVFEHSPFLLLGSWFAIIATTSISWTLEESAPSPSMMHLGGMIALGLATLVFVLLSGHGLQLALPLGALLATISATLDLRHATMSRQ